MHFVVTGGAGFIGNHLVHYLIHKGHSVDVIDNIHVGRIENLTDIKNEITFHQMDILEYDRLRKIVKNTDGIFHEAALTSVQESFIKSREYDMVNVTGTENIFKLAKEFDIKVVYASSTSVYGNPLKIPVKEDFPRKPINPYGETKLQAELLAEKYISNEVTIVGLRYFNVYGKGQSSSYAGVITKFLERMRNNQSPIIYGDGLQIRDFVYVDDVAKANLLAMEKNITSPFINIGSGEITSIRDLAQMITDIADLGLKPIYDKSLEGDVRESLADIRLAKKLLGWKPEMKLKNWLTQILQSKK